MAEPLTPALPFEPEQVERWRQEVTNRTVRPDMPWTDREVIVLVHRFLATLDAARESRALDDRLRVAAWRLSNAAASLARYASFADQPAYRSWFPSAIGDVEREVRLARAAAGSEPTPAEYAALSDPGKPEAREDDQQWHVHDDGDAITTHRVEEPCPHPARTHGDTE